MDQEIQYRKYVLIALEKIYNLYSCIMTLDWDILLLSKRIKYSPDLLNLMQFTKDFLKEVVELSYPLNDILIKCSDWKVAIQTLPSSNSNEPLLFIALIPYNSKYFRRAIQWGVKMMTALHH